MPYDPADAETQAEIAKAVAAATKPLADSLRDLNANLGKLRGEYDSVSERATKAETDLRAALDSGTATATEIEALRGKVAAAEKADKDRADAARAARLGKIPEAARAKAPTDPAALDQWLDIAETMQRLPAIGSPDAGGTQAGPTEADIEFAKSKGFGDAAPAKILAFATKHAPHRKQKSA